MSKNARLNKLEEYLDPPEYNPWVNRNTLRYRRKASETILIMGEGFPVREFYIPFSELWFEHPICLSAYMFALLNMKYDGSFVWFDKAVTGYLSSFQMALPKNVKKNYYSIQTYNNARRSLEYYKFVLEELEKNGFISPERNGLKKVTVWKIRVFPKGAPITDFALSRLEDVRKTNFPSIHLTYWWLLYFGNENFTLNDFCQVTEMKWDMVQRNLSTLQEYNLLKNTWLKYTPGEKKWANLEVETHRSKLLSREEILALGGANREFQMLLDDKRRIEAMKKSVNVDGIAFWNAMNNGKMDFGLDDCE